MPLKTGNFAISPALPNAHAGLSSEYARCHARLDALANVKAAKHVLVGVELDRGAANWAEELALYLASLMVGEHAAIPLVAHWS